MAYADRYEANNIVANASTATIKVVKAKGIFEPTTFATTAVATSKASATTVEGTCKDERTIIYVDSACTLEILAGNGYAGVNDVVMQFTGAGFFTVDSARIVNMQEVLGADNTTVLVPKGQFKVWASSGTPKIAVLEG